MGILHVGQSWRHGAHLAHDNRWAHGRKTTQAVSSMQILHIRSSFSFVFSAKMVSMSLLWVLSICSALILGSDWCSLSFSFRAASSSDSLSLKWPLPAWSFLVIAAFMAFVGIPNCSISVTFGDVIIMSISSCRLIGNFRQDRVLVLRREILLLFSLCTESGQVVEFGWCYCDA